MPAIGDHRAAHSGLDIDPSCALPSPSTEEQCGDLPGIARGHEKIAVTLFDRFFDHLFDRLFDHFFDRWGFV